MPHDKMMLSARIGREVKVEISCWEAGSYSELVGGRGFRFTHISSRPLPPCVAETHVFQLASFPSPTIPLGLSGGEAARQAQRTIIWTTVLTEKHLLRPRKVAWGTKSSRKDVPKPKGEAPLNRPV